MMAFAQNLAFAIPSFLVILGLVVTIHELGHFWVARWCGVAIERFSIGFGRAIFSKRDKHGIEWRVGWIPLGGYVMFAGDDNASSVPDREDLAEMRAEIVAREGAGAEKKRRLDLAQLTVLENEVGHIVQAPELLERRGVGGVPIGCLT